MRRLRWRIGREEVGWGGYAPHREAPPNQAGETVVVVMNKFVQTCAEDIVENWAEVDWMMLEECYWRRWTECFDWRHVPFDWSENSIAKGED